MGGSHGPTAFDTAFRSFSRVLYHRGEPETRNRHVPEKQSSLMKWTDHMKIPRMPDLTVLRTYIRRDQTGARAALQQCLLCEHEADQNDVA